jgi:hypothetical protein
MSVTLKIVVAIPRNALSFEQGFSALRQVKRSQKKSAVTATV